jgi:uncharacterized membrane protein
MSQKQGITPPGNVGFDLPAVPAWRCLDWLARGWRDLWHAPALALAHGLVMALVGAALFALAADRFWVLAGAFSGFLLVAPVLATGLYEVSRTLERGGQANFATVRSAWTSGNLRLVLFGFLLALAGTGWVMTSAAMITLWAPQPVNTPADFLRHVVVGDTWLFEAWVVMGALLAAPVFGSSVIAMPLLLERPTSVLNAVLTSWRVVLANPIPMAVWAAVIMLLTMVGMFTVMIGLIVLLPLLGHASWHAYRDLVRGTS